MFYSSESMARGGNKMGKKMKKAAAAICLGAAVLTSVPAVSFAETAVEPVHQQDSEIAPRMQYISSARCSLEIDGTTATVDCWVKGDYLTATKAKVIAELQLKNGSSWIPVAIWTDTKEDYEAYLCESKAVSKGCTYRAKATVTVWEGSQSETQTFFTEERTVGSSSSP